MQDLKKMIDINKRFQKSVNIKLDYNQLEKIKGYIPTRASIQVLKSYLQQIGQNKGMRSSILIGPYGKGKSHLLLVLLALLSKENRQSDENGRRETIESTIEKIKNADKEAGILAEQFIEKEKFYLPVIVSGIQNDLGRALLLALRDGLERAGIGEIAPDTYFEEAIKTIQKWKTEYPDTYTGFLRYIEQDGMVEEIFLKQLSRYEESALIWFKKIYPELTAGGVFEPMVQMSIITLYESVKETLCRQYGYSGIVVIFDEFSKFVEGYPKERFSAAMEDLQNLCELANSSKEQELHVILVAHKAMKEYKRSLPKEVINAYTGVEGRLGEIYFTSSLKNSYELIQNVILKQEPEFETTIVRTEQFQNMAEEAYTLPYFKNLFSKEEFMEIVAKGCYPLTPVAAYLLLKISEIAVQNERTVFTFLANEEPHSLLDFLERQNDTEKEYVTAGQIYDYFSHILKRDSSDLTIHNEWLKAEYALLGERSETEAEIIKTIALVSMVGKYDEMLPKDDVLRLGAGLDLDIYKEAIMALKEQQVLLFRSKTRIYAFKNQIGVDVEQEIRQMIERKFQTISLCEELEKISELEYELPKRYNQEFTMTRYFHYQFMTVENFLHLQNTEYLFEHKFADGKIIALIREKEYGLEGISKHLKNLADRRVVVVYPEEFFLQRENIKKILAIRQLKQTEEFIEDNKALQQELSLYEEDLLFEVNAMLEQDFLPFYGKCTVLYDGEQYGTEFFGQKKSSSKFNQMLSQILAQYYSCTPKINNELINKCTLSTQIRKARKNIMENILGEANFSAYGVGTTPEATIFRAVFLHTGVLELPEYPGKAIGTKDAGVERVLGHIRAFLESAADEKRSFQELYRILQGESFGIRKGVLPLYLAYELAKWNEMPVFYLQEKEVACTSEILENINLTPEEYFLYMEQETVEKERYLQGLEELFPYEVKSIGKQGTGNRFLHISNGMYQWFCSLPQCSRTYSIDEKTEQEQAVIKIIRKEFSKIERNAREVLLDKLPKAFENTTKNPFVSYGELLSCIQREKQEMEQYLFRLKRQVVEGTREILGLSKKEDFMQSLKQWQKEQTKQTGNQIYHLRVNRFLMGISNLSTYDEIEIAGELSRMVLDLFVEDWKNNSLEQYRESLTNIKNLLEECNKQEQKGQTQKLVFTNSLGIEIEKHFSMEENDGTSQFLENEIESAIEEFGDSLEINQKISVMVRMIEKLLEG